MGPRLACQPLAHRRSSSSLRQSRDCGRAPLRSAGPATASLRSHPRPHRLAPQPAENARARDPVSIGPREGIAFHKKLCAGFAWRSRSAICGSVDDPSSDGISPDFIRDQYHHHQRHERECTVKRLEPKEGGQAPVDPLHHVVIGHRPKPKPTPVAEQAQQVTRSSMNAAGIVRCAGSAGVLPMRWAINAFSSCARPGRLRPPRLRR